MSNPKRYNCGSSIEKSGRSYKQGKSEMVDAPHTLDSVKVSVEANLAVIHHWWKMNKTYGGDVWLKRLPEFDKSDSSSLGKPLYHMRTLLGKSPNGVAAIPYPAYSARLSVVKRIPPNRKDLLSLLCHWYSDCKGATIPTAIQLSTHR
jgi:hypothetical protein